MRFFATCAQALEYPLIQELEALGATACAETRAGVSFEGSLETAYRACLWSRFASRILMPLADGNAEDTDGLYELAAGTPWEEVLPRGCSFAVHAASRHPAITNSRFAALRIKDGIVDRLGRDHATPDPENPAITVYAFADQEGATVGIDLSGRSLHERSYRVRGVKAPLKENAAAAVLWRAGWPEATALVDPFCGSGTLLIEAAMAAADIAPGLGNPNFGLQELAGFDAAAWNRLTGEAEERRREGLARLDTPIVGFDVEGGAVAAARENCRAAGLGGKIRVESAAIRDFPVADVLPAGGLLATNPPYGKRLDPGHRGLFELYRVLGAGMARNCPGTRLAVLTAHDELAREIQLPLESRFRIFNGPIPCRLFVFAVGDRPAEPSEGAVMVANRIGKNRRKLKSYLKKNQISSYRAYDADIPEYAVAVDVYDEHLHVQEYAAPGNIPEATTRKRLHEALDGICNAFDAEPGQLFVKTRSRQKGDAQYTRQAEEKAEFWVREGGLEFKVNLSDYLDTGLFLDHRETRARIRSLARNRSFLNLFCYTGSATVYAAAGGAKHSVSVDLSRTYLRWTEENLVRNGFGGNTHRLARADCLQWIRRCREKFDLIFLDPPTFSTSKAMRERFDIQQDHPQLIRHCMRCLAPGGLLIFSNNFKSFKMDSKVMSDYHCEDITAESVPPDYARGNPHQCWELRHPGDSR
ncbi:MAG: bifunctional 23S rRNA (guanine(2069)-N(7))-methyltransferase RlmK/23S rRNA (guanine(2445)-N(2))-methyltransferase RlmL [Xanthomonadales bacterium]|nr:bifunctional 23S rRNA (guanine(2069)-N(7))-methyltransferase RlmK/23S rRNA (guanine(2445)-N(2))-methyltransferase RlmL [Xanthomonadales bacterium]